MSKAYKDMKKDELLKAIKFFKLDEEVSKAEEEKGSALINSDYIKILEAHKLKQDEINGATETDDEDTESAEKVKPKVPKTREDRAVLAAEYNMTKTMILVTDHDNTAEMDSDVAEKGVKICWGNKLLGNQTDVVFMHGEPQYVRNGAIEAMKTMLVPTNSKDKTARSKKRFSITEVEGWTQEKLDELKEQQKLKGN